MRYIHQDWLISPKIPFPTWTAGFLQARRHPGHSALAYGRKADSYGKPKRITSQASCWSTSILINMPVLSNRSLRRWSVENNIFPFRLSRLLMNVGNPQPKWCCRGRFSEGRQSSQRLFTRAIWQRISSLLGSVRNIVKILTVFHKKRVVCNIWIQWDISDSIFLMKNLRSLCLPPRTNDLTLL